jgi:ADP-L-glycero-D-manno-heptose 6-epimerase
MIIVTGDKGFIGKNFKKYLFNEELIGVDLEDTWSFLQLFDDWENVDLIIHQGAVSSTTEKDIRHIYNLNIDYTLSLFEVAIKYGIPVKYASSASIYGNKNDGTANPLNQYAISKLQIDYWVQDNMDKFPLIQGFRYFNVYGDHENNKGNQASPVSKFTKQVKEKGYLELFEGSEKFLRDFICVDDLVEIVLNNKKHSGIFDLGTSLPVSFYDVANSVVNRYGGEIKTIPFPEILIGRYQDYTCAKSEWEDFKFKTIDDYLREKND